MLQNKKVYKFYQLWRYIFFVLIFVWLVQTPVSAEQVSDVQQTETNEVDWIERIVIPDEIRAFYDKLIEGSDNDGVEDFLIEDAYFSGENRILAATVKGTAKSEMAMYDKIAADIETYVNYIYAAYSAFRIDHPEVFWLKEERWYEWEYSWKYTGQRWEYRMDMYFRIKDDDVDMRIDEYKSESIIKSDIQVRDARVAEILNLVEGKSTYEKILYFNNILAIDNEYNTTEDLDTIERSCRECISALIGRTGTVGPVCSAYANAFKVLCDAASIPCTSVIGVAKSSVDDEEAGLHQWSYVQLEDNWYAVDVTWNDDVNDWFLLGSDTMIRNMRFIDSHPVENKRSGIIFSNGPILNKEAYDKRYPTKTELISIGTSEGQTNKFTYGDTIEIRVNVTTSERFNSTLDDIAIYVGEREIKPDNWYIGEDGEEEDYVEKYFKEYVLTYSTLNHGILEGEQTLTLQFKEKDLSNIYYGAPEICLEASNEVSVPITLEVETDILFAVKEYFWLKWVYLLDRMITYIDGLINFTGN